jgi:hypothetical protein
MAAQKDYSGQGGWDKRKFVKDTNLDGLGWFGVGRFLRQSSVHASRPTHMNAGALLHSHGAQPAGNGARNGKAGTGLEQDGKEGEPSYPEQDGRLH